MKRREFLSLLGGVVAPWPLPARAQQMDKVWRVGFLAGGSRPAQLLEPYGAFLRGMRELSYVEGKDFVIEWRFAEGRNELFPELAAELVRANVDRDRRKYTVSHTSGAASDQHYPHYHG
jgi:putative ABC transport system substrate-binding protein